MKHPNGFISAFLVLSCFFLGGCGEQQLEKGLPAKPLETLKTDSGADSKRFKVVSHGMFEAGYRSNQREILIITDTKTNRQYLAITGCGVTELILKHEGDQTVTREE